MPRNNPRVASGDAPEPCRAHPTPGPDVCPRHSQHSPAPPAAPCGARGGAGAAGPGGQGEHHPHPGTTAGVMASGHCSPASIRVGRLGTPCPSWQRGALKAASPCGALAYKGSHRGHPNGCLGLQAWAGFVYVTSSHFKLSVNEFTGGH